VQKLNPIVTITTDFGTGDGFVAQMKGVILRICPRAELIDVTHDIRPFSVIEGALVIKGVSRYFPVGTIHVAVVDPGVGGPRRGIVLNCEGQIYVGPDNGLFSLISADSRDGEIREIVNPDLMLPKPHPTFHGRDVFAPVAAHLAEGVPMSVAGPVVDDPVTLDVPGPIKTEDGVRSEVIYVDRFGNLSCNIDAEHLNREVGIVEIGDTRIPGLSVYFGQAPEGTVLALINSFGLLEIAVNRGDAARTLGVNLGAPVRVLWAE
jgi:S-adenosyl-L-methionine hydrolase (adenosine-forming)